MRKTRIKRKKIGEETILPVLPEDFQDRFEKLIDAGYHTQDTFELLKADLGNPEKHKAHFLAREAEMIIFFSFWRDLREKINNWHEALGVRDGYELVRELPIPPRPHFNLMSLLDPGPEGE